MITTTVGALGKRRKADNFVEPRVPQPAPCKRALAHRTDGGNFAVTQTPQRPAPKERPALDRPNGHTGKIDVVETRTPIEGVSSDFRDGFIFKAHRIQINGAFAKLRGNFIRPVIDDQAVHPSTIDGILIRLALVDLHHYVSVWIARVHIAAWHKLGILINRIVLVCEGIGFAVIGRGLRRCSQTLYSIGVGRGSCEVLDQTRRESVGIRA